MLRHLLDHGISHISAPTLNVQQILLVHLVDLAFRAFGKLVAQLVDLVVSLLQLSAQFGVAQIVGSEDLSTDLLQLRCSGAELVPANLLRVMYMGRAEDGKG